MDQLIAAAKSGSTAWVTASSSFGLTLSGAAGSCRTVACCPAISSDWIDRKNGFGGYWATQILPFADPVSFGGYMEFETAAYATGQARAAA